MGLFTDITLKKKEINFELKVYKDSKIKEVDAEVAEYIKVANKRMANLAIRWAEDAHNYEHEFHFKKETMGIELAKVEAQITERLKHIKDLKFYDDTIHSNKDNEITRLNEIILKLIDNPSTQIITKKI